MKKEITITAQDVRKACSVISAFADCITPSSQENPAGTVTSYLDDEGNFLGVRVRAMGEDFVIEPRDFNDGKELNWYDTMKTLKEAGKTTWTYRQICLTMFYREEIDAILEANGGDILNNWYWTCAEYSAYAASYYFGSAGSVNYGLKTNTGNGRALLALQKS